ncbi:MAG: lanthionine synthetase LanC family protein, partial [Solirubrobacteraceae bacterium]
GRHASVLEAREGDGSFVALKVATTGLGAQLVARDGRMLDALGSCEVPAPRLVEVGRIGDRPYCASPWTSGVEARIAAAEAREGGSSAQSLELCRRVARAYVALHGRGILHGHVHPRHVLVDVDGAVGLVDLSLAATAADAPPASLLGSRFNSLSAPETARAVLAGEAPQLTPAAEQYSLAALLYLLFTGRMYARLRLKRQELAHDIIDLAPLAFGAHGLPGCPALEAVVGRALAKDPKQRYASLGAFASELDALEDATKEPQGATTRPISIKPPLARMLETFWRETASGPPETLAPPRCSVNLGAAGVAFALARLGRVTGDPRAFELGERWLAYAERHCFETVAFDDGDQLTPDRIGVISPFHTLSGLAAVRAVLADATGDIARQQSALDDYRLATAGECRNLDLTLGRSSVLLVAAILYARADPHWPAAQRLRTDGERLCRGIWRDLAQTAMPYNGIAHGWAGVAYASMIWAAACGVEPPAEVRAVLEMLAAAAEPHGRGARWPVTPLGGPAGDQHWPGWCHGNAGYVFLWNLAYASYRDDAYALLAERAAQLLDAGVGVSSLCCGSAGIAYAALSQYRATRDERWRAGALRIAEHSAEHDAIAGDAASPLSLYKGYAGLALLAAELERPERAAMPLFEPEPPVVQS